MANQGCFGKGSYYSNKSPNVARVLGRHLAPRTVMFQIQSSRNGRRRADGVYERVAGVPFLRDDIGPFYFAGNSAGYALQWAHLMGASEVLLMGFTMRDNSGYFFTHSQRPTRLSGVYNPRVLDFLRFVNREKPGFVKLVRGWEGPIYDLGLEEVELTAEDVVSAKAPVSVKHVIPWS